MTQEDKKVLGNAADTLLQQPTIVTVDILNPNRLQRLLMRLGIIPRKKRFKINAACLATMIRISKILLDIDFDAFKDTKSFIRTNYELIAQHARGLCTVIALAMGDGKSEPTEKEVDFLCQNLTAAEIKMLLTVVFHKLNIEDFMLSIMSVQGMSLLNPKE